MLRQSDRVRGLRWMPVSRFGRIELGMTALLLVAASGVLFFSIEGRRAPDADAVSLSFPLEGGDYYIANGGSSDLLNAHVRTLHDARFSDFRGQSYAVDIVKLGTRDLRASGVAPHDPARYASFGEPVYSPCGGLVLRAQNGAPDMPPPLADREHLAGNFLLIDCGTAHVVLAHFRQGSLLVQAGDTVARGQQVGAIGNSGNTGEPHLHLHAQRAGTGDTFMAADPLPVRFDGRFLARNDIVRANRAGTFSESEMLYGQIVSTIVALLMLIVSLRSVRAARLMFVALFAWAAMANLRVALQQPTAYIGYAWLTVSEAYRNFILGWFASHVTPFVATIAGGQALIAILLLTGRARAERLGLIGAIVFLMAIAPLGVGSGFPATVIMALAAVVILRENGAPVFGRLVRATREEAARRLPGDELIPEPTGAVTHAVSIARPATDVWPWLVQMGAGRGGWYTYDFLDNRGYHSATRIVPELQHIKIGTLFAALPGAKEGFFVQDFEEERMLMLVAPGPTGLHATWTFFLEEPSPGTTRLIVRARIAYRPFGLPIWMGILLARGIHFIMERKQLAGIAARVEHPRSMRAA